MSTSLTIRARIMYPHLFTPHLFNDDEADAKPMYRASLILRDDDKAVGEVQAIVDQLIASELDGGPVAEDNKTLKRDGTNEALNGCWVIKSKSQYKPNVLENGPTGMVPIMNTDKPADGDWVFANISLYTYNTKGKKGVGASLNGILFASKGEVQLGKSSAPTNEEMFGGVVAGAEQQTAPAAATGAGANPFGG